VPHPLAKNSNKERSMLVMIDIGILISIRYQYHFDQNIVIIDE